MIIGREKELEQLHRAFNSEKAELVAVYGRRRIGKTYLIHNAFSNFFFSYTGAYGVSTIEQLCYFHEALVKHGFTAAETPRNWHEAFNHLRDFIESSKAKRKVIFIDELPWMDSPRSGFVSAFEHFWNGWGALRNDILFIICGSASSWIIEKIFRNKGGLHNRVTYRIHLNQFSLHEVELFTSHYKMGYSRNQIMEGYMVMGGVPFYWSKIQPSKSITQNINDLFLNPDGELRYEFNELYASIFNRPEKYISVIEALSTKKKGLTRDEIVKATKLGNNGHLSSILEDLVECGFIRKYCHTDKRLKDAIYQLVDCYTLFYYQFVEKAHGTDEEYWLKLQTTPKYNTWCGLAFERICLLHSRQIKRGLGISGIMANIYAWHTPKTADHDGIQIDMLIDRADNVVSICEMKYAPYGYKMTETEVKKLQTRRNVFAESMPKRKGLQVVLITSNGVIGNHHSDIVQQVLTADILFAE